MGAAVEGGPAEGPTGGSGPFDRRLVAQVPTVRPLLVASVALGLVSTLSVVVQAVFLARLLASAMPGASPAGRAADMAWVAAAAAARALTALAAEPLARVGAASAKAHLRRRLVMAVVGRSPGRAQPSAGEIATVAGRGLDALDVYLGRCLPDLVLAATAPVALLLAVGMLDWVSALVLVVAVGLFPVFGALVGRASTALAAANEALREASVGTLRVAFLSALVLDTLASVSVALVAVPLGLRLLDGSIRLPGALAVLIVAPEVLLPLRRASAEFHESTEGLAAAARVLPLVACEQDPGPAVPGGRARGPVHTQVPLPPAPDPVLTPVTLRAVRVTAPERTAPVLDGVTLSIEPGETLAMVGPNGAGKSTVAALLLGFCAPDDGVVEVGGTDLARIDLDAWRRRVTYLSSHPALVAGSLADNLRLGRPDATDGELLEALAAAGAADLVSALPRGLATRLGDGGRPTSAGERQRIALARTLLRPASLYVLDEPTEHLDERSEALAVRSLAAALSGRSALVITHRPAVLALADRVVTLAGGRLVAPQDPNLRPPFELAGAPA